MNTIIRTFQELKRYPSAIIGLIIIFSLLALATYTLISIPYSEAIRLWRAGEEVWGENPRNASPEWVNLFRREKLPKTIVLASDRGTAEKTVETTSSGKEIIITFTFDYPYDVFPQDMLVYINAVFDTRQPHLMFTWYTPDGREIRIGDISPRQTEAYRFTLESRLQRRLGGLAPNIGLFADPDSETPVVLQGEYKLELNGLVFEENGDIEAAYVNYGLVHGLAGTDHRRRDLTIALMWGTPIALAFGLLAALGTTVTTMVIAAIGVWYSGIVDSLIQRITQVNLILPLIPILIMVGTFVDRSIWVILSAVILLSIFGSGILTYRAIFLQVRESPYIEAARAYGAGSWRIILRYLIPRIIPLLIPQLVVLIPSFVFLEASLAVLGLGDPILPTWGKIIDDANRQGALFNGYYYWVLEPALLLMLTGLGFSMVGFSLDRIFNPRLRGL
jgi:peptide/nickel transport system permease protein